MKHILTISFVCYILSFGVGCTAELRIKTNALEPKLVITGAIFNDRMSQYINVAETSPFFEGDLPQNIDASYVSINSEELKRVATGIYSTSTNFTAVPGETYVLDVAIDYDKDGTIEHYTASTTVPEVHYLDKVDLSMILAKKQNNPPWFLVAGFQDSPGTDYYAAKLYINNALYSNRLLRCYIHDLNDYKDDGEYLQFPIYEWIITESLPWDNNAEYKLYSGDVLTVELNTLAADYYEYLSDAKDEVSQQVPLFSGQRGNVKGNISGGALGIFGSYTISSASVVIPDCPDMPFRE